MRNIAIFFVAAFLAACRGQDAPTVARAWVRLPAVAGRPGVAYFTLTGGTRDTSLVRIESALVRQIELHQSMAAGGGGAAMATMVPLQAVALPAGRVVTFAPGGSHAMLIGLDPLVKPGTAVPLRFGFADRSTAEAEAKTVAAGDDAPY